MRIKLIILMALAFSSTATADSIDIRAEFIKQMDYKVSRAMPCNWDFTRTQIFGYYGELPPADMRGPIPGSSQPEGDLKSKLAQINLELPTVEAFGLNLNLEFTPEMMEHDGKPLQIVEIDYKPLNKDCTTGFSDLLTR